MRKSQGKTWFIPHHGVYHPSKPGKIRVVFHIRVTIESRSRGDKIADAYLEPCQIWKMVLLAKTVNSFQSLTIFAKSSVLDV